MKESFAVGADQPTGDPEVDGYWFQANVYPAEVPGLQAAVVGYLARMHALADELLVLCADAVIESLRPPIGRPNDFAPVVSAQFLRERYDAVTIG